MTKRKQPIRGNVIIRLFLLICLMLVSVVVGGVATALWRSRNTVTGPAPGAATVRPAATPAARASTPTAATQPVPTQPSAVSASQVQVFFTSDGVKLRPQVIEVPRAMSPHERLKFVMDELFRGPMSASLKPAVPEGTQLLASFIRDDVATIDVSGAIAKQPLGGTMSELLCVNAIAQTVVRNIDSVKSVQILVDGHSLPILWDQVDLTSPIVPDDSLVQK